MNFIDTMKSLGLHCVLFSEIFVILVIVFLYRHNSRVDDSNKCINYFKFTPSLDHAKRAKKDSLKIDEFSVYIAPADGPRGFVMMGFDIQFVELAHTGHISGSKWFLGGSTAAMRFCAIISSVISGDSSITNSIKEHFVQMTYRDGDTPQILSPMMEAMFMKCAPTHLLRAIIDHPSYHLAIVINAMPAKYVDYPDWRLKLVFLWYFLVNTLAPSLLAKYYFKQICFYSGTSPPPFLSSEVETYRLTSENFYAVLRATTCIPFVSERISYIPGVATRHLFYDGGIFNYLCNVSVKDDIKDHIKVLYLGGNVNGKTRVKRTLFDLFLPWRSVPEELLLANVSMVSPTDVFLNRTPDMRLPCVIDWFRPLYVQNPEMRKQNWRAVYDLATKTWDTEKPAGK